MKSIKLKFISILLSTFLVYPNPLYSGGFNAVSTHFTPETWRKIKIERNDKVTVRVIFKLGEKRGHFGVMFSGDCIKIDDDESSDSMILHWNTKNILWEYGSTLGAIQLFSEFGDYDADIYRSREFEIDSNLLTFDTDQKFFDVSATLTAGPTCGKFAANVLKILGVQDDIIPILDTIWENKAYYMGNKHLLLNHFIKYFSVKERKDKCQTTSNQHKIDLFPDGEPLNFGCGHFEADE
jgi:hypothetical protein